MAEKKQHFGDNCPIYFRTRTCHDKNLRPLLEKKSTTSAPDAETTLK